MPIEETPGEFSPEDAQAVGVYLLEMTLLERAVDRALLDQYAKDDVRDSFMKHFLGRKTLGPKVDAIIEVVRLGLVSERVVTAEEAEHHGAQLRELVSVRNEIAHRAPDFEPSIGEREDAVESRARYGNLEAFDLLQLVQLSAHARAFLSQHLHRPLVIDDPNDDPIVQ